MSDDHNKVLSREPKTTLFWRQRNMDVFDD